VPANPHVDSCVCPSFGDGDGHYSCLAPQGQHLSFVVQMGGLLAGLRPSSLVYDRST
jgi:hypothetical protein